MIKNVEALIRVFYTVRETLHKLDDTPICMLKIVEGSNGLLYSHTHNDVNELIRKIPASVLRKNITGLRVSKLESGYFVIIDVG